MALVSNFGANFLPLEGGGRNATDLDRRVAVSATISHGGLSPMAFPGGGDAGPKFSHPLLGAPNELASSLTRGARSSPFKGEELLRRSGNT